MKVVDVSGIGTTVTFSCGELNEVSFSDVSDTNAPIQLETTTVSDVVIDLNEEGFAARKKMPIRLTLSFLPGSNSDMKMANYLMTCRSSRPSKMRITTATIAYPSGIGLELSAKSPVDGKGTKVKLVDGWLLSGQPGYGITNEGRLDSRVYVFAFADYNIE